MKTTATTFLTVFFLSVLTQSGQAQRDAGFFSNPLTVNYNPLRVSYSPLTVNGQPLVYEYLALNSRGVLAMVKNNPASAKSEHVLLRAYLRRAGAVITDAREGYTIQLEQLLPVAQPGDELIVEPARATDGQGKRVIRLQGFNWLIWAVRPRQGDGC